MRMIETLLCSKFSKKKRQPRKTPSPSNTNEKKGWKSANDRVLLVAFQWKLFWREIYFSTFADKNKRKKIGAIWVIRAVRKALENYISRLFNSSCAFHARNFLKWRKWVREREWSLRWKTGATMNINFIYVRFKFSFLSRALRFLRLPSLLSPSTLISFLSM